MLYLVRHGRTQVNAQNRLQGRLDPPLDALGERQAHSVAQRVQALVGDSGVARVVASPLLRAQQTAERFIDVGLVDAVDTDDRWVELNYGCYEGVAMADVPGDVWQRWYDDPTFATEGGESFDELEQRVHTSIAELAEQARDDNVVVVAHVTPIKAAVAWSLGARHDLIFRCHLSHAALSVIGFGRFGPVLHRFNDTVEVGE